MSTRSVIARKTSCGFAGVYHHWDGYPSGLGAALFRLLRKQYRGDVSSMLAELIDSHPAGWATVVNADWSLPIGFSDVIDATDAPRGPECYCHGARAEKPNPLDESNAAACGCEWAYVFTDDGRRMEVWSSHTDPTKGPSVKMIGMFGYGDPQAVWRLSASVRLDGREPKWQHMNKSIGIRVE